MSKTGYCDGQHSDRWRWSCEMMLLQRLDNGVGDSRIVRGIADKGVDGHILAPVSNISVRCSPDQHGSDGSAGIVVLRPSTRRSTGRNACSIAVVRGGPIRLRTPSACRIACPQELDRHGEAAKVVFNPSVTRLRIRVMVSTPKFCRDQDISHPATDHAVPMFPWITLGPGSSSCRRWTVSIAARICDSRGPRRSHRRRL